MVDRARVLLSLNENMVERDNDVTPPEVAKMDISDVPTRVGLKKVRKFDLWSEFDDEMVEDYRDFMSWFRLSEHSTLLSLPAPKKGDFIPVELDQDGDDVSAFNTCDFRKDTPKFDKYGYRIRKVMEKVGDLAMQHSCIADAKGRDGVRKMCKGLLESEFLIEALDAQKEGDTRRFKRLMKRVEQCADVWKGWNPA